MNGGAVERLDFRDIALHYHAYDAATHVARYLAARPFCAGKRVLDIACGEGYGSFLLAQWGAELVLGIDISEAAISSANAVFAHQRVRFVAGSETALDQLVGGYGPFDLIVCLETIEHVADPAAFLRRLRVQLAPDGVLLVSCPHQPDASADDGESPYHLSHWSFSGFRSFAEEVLGPASQWLLETPAIGVTLYDAFGPATDPSGGTPREALMMPAKQNLVPGPDDCIAYLGIWGATLGEAVACTAVSLSGFLQPWREAASRDGTIAKLAETTDRLLREQQEDRQQLLHYSALLASEPARGNNLVGIEASRAFRLTRSRRIARLYIRLFTPPAGGRTLRAVGIAVGRLLRRDYR